MTRIAILSDIHGNLPALEAVIADMQATQPDHVVVNGDIINGVPFDAEVLERIIGCGWTVLRGNHEYYLMDYGTTRERPHMRFSPSPAWLDARLRGWLPYIGALPEALTLHYRDGPPVCITHGYPGFPWDAPTMLTPDADVMRWLRGVEPTLYVCGHYHLPLNRQIGRWRVLNPGPVGAVMDGTHDACYLLLDAAGDHWQPTFRRVPYDFALVEAAFQQHQLDTVLGVEGRLKCEQLRWSRPLITAFNRWLEAQHPGLGWTMAQAEAFLALPLAAIWPYLDAAYHVNPPDFPLNRAESTKTSQQS